MSEPKVTTLPQKSSGIRAALRYTGIPVSWLDKRPKLPSRNWLIFLSVTSSIAGLYIYDRRQCKKIRQRYVDKVKDLAEESVSPLETPRKVTVYGSKWPGDEEYDQSLKYFRKYVKPILVAAAVDYDLVTVKRHGELANRVANDIKARRRSDVGLDVDSEVTKSLPTYKPPAVRRQHELEGGIVLVGRPAFKEFMAGLYRGWTEGLDKVDKDDILARELSNDGHFDEPEEPEHNPDQDGTTQNRIPQLKTSPFYSPIQIRSPAQVAQSNSTGFDSSSHVPLATIPPIPPLLLVSFTNYIGFTQIPLMIWDFFNQRHKFRAGAEAGFRLVKNVTRPFNAPPPTDLSESSSFSENLSTSSPPTHQDLGDLDFDKKAESFYKKSLSSFITDIEKARKKYYEALPAKLETARALSRGIREPTKEEQENAPPTEVELQAERLSKEKRWRSDLEGWDVVKPSSKVVWDERFRDALRVFVDPSTDDID